MTMCVRVSRLSLSSRTTPIPTTNHVQHHRHALGEQHLQGPAAAGRGGGHRHGRLRGRGYGRKWIDGCEHVIMGRLCMFACLHVSLSLCAGGWLTVLRTCLFCSAPYVTLGQPTNQQPGGNTLSFAQHFARVHAVELDDQRYVRACVRGECFDNYRYI